MLTRRHASRGETLVELMVTITILSIMVVALLTAIDSATRASGSNRRQAEMETWLRSAAEKLEDANTRYITCAGKNSSYTLLAAPNAGYDTSATVAFPDANATSLDASSAPTACPPDSGLQLITLSISVHGSSQRETLQIVKRDPNG